MRRNRREAAPPTRHPRQSGLRYLWALPALLIVAAALGLGWRAETSRPGSSQSLSAAPPTPAVARRETRPTLDPARFVGKARLAHQVAREIPDTLDQLYCYCECDKHAGHKSLLSCYTDGHAAT